MMMMVVVVPATRTRSGISFLSCETLLGMVTLKLVYIAMEGSRSRVEEKGETEERRPGIRTYSPFATPPHLPFRTHLVGLGSGSILAWAWVHVEEQTYVDMVSGFVITPTKST